jgi:Flp pilus assembly protein TadB
MNVQLIFGFVFEFLFPNNSKLTISLSIMKNSYAFTFLILLNLFLIPFQSVQAALVPVEKTSNKTKPISKKIKKKKFLSSKKQSKIKFKNNRKKQLYKPNQQNNYGVITTILIGAICLYFLIPVTFLIVGLVLAIPGLWITGIVLFALPFIILLIILISNRISDAKYEKERKKEEERLEKEMENKK